MPDSVGGVMVETVECREMTMEGIGDNNAGASVCVEVRLFNTLSRRNGGDSGGREMHFAAGSSMADLLHELEIPRAEIFLVMVNGRDITPGLYNNQVRTDYFLQDGDVVALSGPVPYSWGYGSPIV